MTHGREITISLGKQFNGDHRHTKLEGGNRTRKAPPYPEYVCRCILKGRAGQIRQAGEIEVKSGKGIMRDEQNLEYMAVSELDSVYPGKCYDDIAGEELDSKSVDGARQEEMQEVYKHNRYDNVPIQQCWKETGKGPIGTRWSTPTTENHNTEYR